MNINSILTEYNSVKDSMVNDVVKLIGGNRKDYINLSMPDLLDIIHKVQDAERNLLIVKILIKFGGETEDYEEFSNTELKTSIDTNTNPFDLYESDSESDSDS